MAVRCLDGQTRSVLVMVYETTTTPSGIAYHIHVVDAPRDPVWGRTLTSGEVLFSADQAALIEVGEAWVAALVGEQAKMHSVENNDPCPNCGGSGGIERDAAGSLHSLEAYECLWCRGTGLAPRNGDGRNGDGGGQA